jgi:threonine/homoserine/homoserine lactone efflux protein
MSSATWLAFATASAVLLVIPGPTILLVISYALGRGVRVALPVAAGVALGDFTAMSLSMLGIGALLAASATLFTVLKWLGAAYLMWLGINLWRAGGRLQVDPAGEEVSSRRILAHAWLVTALNPKSITFFVAFVPQFIDQHAAFWPQVMVLEATFVTLAFLNAAGYALAASRTRSIFSSARAVGVFNRIGGSLLIGAGIAAAGWRSSQ